MVALKGAAVVGAMIKEADRCFNIRVNDGTIFSRFIDAIEKQDLATLEKMTREMALALEQVNTPLEKGGLIYFWFRGQ